MEIAVVAQWIVRQPPERIQQRPDPGDELIGWAGRETSRLQALRLSGSR
jgi:hypothetical protein